MPTLLEKVVGIGSVVVFLVVFRKELASELKLLKHDISQYLKQKATKKSP